MHGPIIGIGMPDVFAFFAKHTGTEASVPSVPVHASDTMVR
jgi:hypothetical protein